MSFHNPFTDEEMRLAQSQPLTQPILMHSLRMGTEALSQFAHQVMLPIYGGQLSLSDRETAIGMTFYRLLGALRTATDLVQPYQFQGLAAITRVSFELCIDIALLTRNLVPDAVEKFHGFTRASRFSAASKLVQFYERQGDDRDEVERAHAAAYREESCRVIDR